LVTLCVGCCRCWLRAPGEAYNVGNDQEMSIAAAAETMAQVAGSDRVRVEYRRSNDVDYLTDNPQRRCPSRESYGGDRLPSRDRTARGLARTLRSIKKRTVHRSRDVSGPMP
jgi:hypothetical protein